MPGGTTVRVSAPIRAKIAVPRATPQYDAVWYGSVCSVAPGTPLFFLSTVVLPPSFHPSLLFCLIFSHLGPPIPPVCRQVDPPAPSGETAGRQGSRGKRVQGGRGGPLVPLPHTTSRCRVLTAEPAEPTRRNLPGPGLCSLGALPEGRPNSENTEQGYGGARDQQQGAGRSD